MLESARVQWMVGPCQHPDLGYLYLIKLIINVKYRNILHKERYYIIIRCSKGNFKNLDKGVRRMFEFGDFLDCIGTLSKQKTFNIKQKYLSNLDIYLFIDMDLSLIKNNHWNMLASIFPGCVRLINSDIDKKYLDKFHDGKMTIHDEKNWIIEKIELYKELKVTKNQIVEASKLLRLRQNSKEFIGLFKKRNTKIISYGIYDLIREFTNSNNLADIEIFANHLIFDENGIVKDFKADKIVVPSNKGKILTDFCRDNNINLDSVVVVGDSKGDESMFLEEPLNILISSNGNGYDIKNVDIILKSTNFKPLVNLFKNGNPSLEKRNMFY